MASLSNGCKTYGNKPSTPKLFRRRKPSLGLASPATFTSASHRPPGPWYTYCSRLPSHHKNGRHHVIAHHHPKLPNLDVCCGYITPSPHNPACRPPHQSGWPFKRSDTCPFLEGCSSHPAPDHTGHVPDASRTFNRPPAHRILLYHALSA